MEQCCRALRRATAALRRAVGRLGLPGLGALVGLLVALAAPPAARANSMPTPEFYIRFSNWPAGNPDIVGAQLQGCLDDGCYAANLLVSQGRCEGWPCLSGEAAYGEGLYPLPTSGRALAFGLSWASRASRSWDDYPRYRVVMALSDGTRPSGLLESDGYRNFHDGRVVGDRIELTSYQQFPETTARTTYVFLAMGFFLLINLITEPLGLALVAWRRRVPRIRGLLVASLPINLISFPLVWGVFPAFTPFAGAEDLALAWASLIFLAVAVGAVAGLTSLPRLRSPWLLAALVALTPLLCFGLPFVSQAMIPLPLPGFPSLTTLPVVNLVLMEAVVILFEGWLYHRVRRGELSLRDGLLVALGGNLVSVAAMLGAGYLQTG